MAMPTLVHIVKCLHCGHVYDWRNSSAYLRMSFCTGICEGEWLKFDIRKATKGATNHG